MTTAGQWLFHGSSEELLKQIPDNSFDSCVTDPPAGVGFMGKKWDSFRRAANPADVGRDNVFGRTSRVAPHSYGESERAQFVAQLVAVFREVLRVLKPGAHAYVWALPRTAHWTTWALEDAGFEIRDRHHEAMAADQGLGAFLLSLDENQREAFLRLLEGQTSPIMHHLFLNGMPKGQDVRRELDMHLCTLEGRHYDKNLPPEAKRREGDHLCPQADGAAHREGWGTGLKPTLEHWILCRKPLDGTQAKNQMAWGVGGINIDATRVPLGSDETGESLNGGTYSGGPKAPHLAGDERTATAAGKYGEAGRLDPEAFKPPDGRWPRHLDFQHAAACQYVGQTRIKAIGGTAQGRMAGKTAIYGETQGSTRAGEATGFGDAEGMETVEEWKCVLGCPVRLLDEQTADASRMFHRFRADVAYFPKAAVSEKEAGVVGEGEQPDDGRDPESLGGNNPRNRGASRRKNSHPTVKSIELMRHLVRLVTPPGGHVLDPYAGTATTLLAARLEGVSATGIEREAEYVAIAKQRLARGIQR